MNFPLYFIDVENGFSILFREISILTSEYVTALAKHKNSSIPKTS